MFTLFAKSTKPMQPLFDSVDETGRPNPKACEKLDRQAVSVHVLHHLQA